MLSNVRYSGYIITHTIRHCIARVIMNYKFIYKIIVKSVNLHDNINAEEQYNYNLITGILQHNHNVPKSHYKSSVYHHDIKESKITVYLKVPSCCYDLPSKTSRFSLIIHNA